MTTDAKTEVRRYVFTALETNNNKFWNAHCEGSDFVTVFGRVGEAGQTSRKPFPSPQLAEAYLEKMCRAKEKKGYTVARTEGNAAATRGRSGAPVPATNLAHLARTQIAAGADPETVRLVEFLAQRNVHAIEGATSIRMQDGVLTTPLGRVTPDGVAEARLLLDQITAFVQSADYGTRFGGLVNDYLRIVPRDIGRRRVEARDIFPDEPTVGKELATLDAVEQAIKTAAAASGDSPEPALVFRTRLTLCTPGGYRFKKVRAAFDGTKNARHTSSRYQLEKVWEVAVEPANEAFEADGARVGNVKSLWHGTTDANLLSLMKSGYVIPKSNGSIRVTGRMFGDGVYFSDQSTKSLNYATGFWGAGASGRTFMLLNDVAMGKEYHPSAPFSGLPPKGYDSTYVRGGTARVMNNEMIVYRASQARPVYLAEFR